MRIFGILCLIILPLVACHEPEEGCLDPLAKNYDVSADEPGPCTYPKLKLNFDYTYDTLIFVSGRAFPAIGIDSIKIDTFRFILSDISLVDENGNKTYTSSNRRTIEVEENMGIETRSVRDDVVIMSPFRTRYTVDRFTHPGMYDSLHVLAGLSEEWEGLLPQSLPELHPLKTIPNLPLEDADGPEGYVSVRTFRDSMPQRQTYRLEINPREIRLSKGSPLVVAAGQDTDINLVFDCNYWIDPIDWANDSRDKIISTLEQRWIASFEWTDD